MSIGENQSQVGAIRDYYLSLLSAITFGISISVSNTDTTDDKLSLQITDLLITWISAVNDTVDTSVLERLNLIDLDDSNVLKCKLEIDAMRLGFLPKPTMPTEKAPIRAPIKTPIRAPIKAPIRAPIKTPIKDENLIRSKVIHESEYIPRPPILSREATYYGAIDMSKPLGLSRMVSSGGTTRMSNTLEISRMVSNGGTMRLGIDKSMRYTLPAMDEDDETYFDDSDDESTFQINPSLTTTFSLNKITTMPVPVFRRTLSVSTPLDLLRTRSIGTTWFN